MVVIRNLRTRVLVGGDLSPHRFADETEAQAYIESTLRPELGPERPPRDLRQRVTFAIEPAPR